MTERDKLVEQIAAARVEHAKAEVIYYRDKTNPTQLAELVRWQGIVSDLQDKIDATYQETK